MTELKTDNSVPEFLRTEINDASAIAGSINKGINNGLLMGVDHVEPKDINVKQVFVNGEEI